MTLINLTYRTLFILVACCSSFARLGGEELDTTRLTQLAEADLRETNTPGAAIAIVRDGKFLWSEGLGLANVETCQPPTAEMLFRLGSTTKMFTAAALVSISRPL